MESSYWTRRRISRRSVLRGTGALGVGAVGAVLIGCGSDDDGGGDATVYRLEAGTWLSAAWVDTSDVAATNGWDNSDALDSEGVVAVAFSPNFDIDDSIVCMTVDYDDLPLY